MNFHTLFKFDIGSLPPKVNSGLEVKIIMGFVAY